MHIEIIIPTIGGRENYLRWCIESCLRQEGEFSVLVSNNGGASGVRDLVASLADPRLRLVEPPAFLPMALHWEFAFSQARGEAITFVGDDDALMPGAIARIRQLFAENPSIECITHQPGQYFWPDYLEQNWRNKYTLARQSGRATVRQTEPLLRQVVEFRALYVVLPYLYHGFVRRATLEGIRSANGGLFRRAMPDVFTDLVLACTLRQFLVTEECLSLGGQGAKSNGANFLLNTELGKDFLADLPDSLLPVQCPNSIYLQLQEYIASLPACAALQRSGHPDWLRFSARVLLEAVQSRKHRKDILVGLARFADQSLPAGVRLAARGMSLLFGNALMAGVASGMLKLRRKANALRWKDASKEFGAANIFDLTLALSRRLHGNRADPQ